jgi:hypothetical protein
VAVTGALPTETYRRWIRKQLGENAGGDPP